MPPPTVNLQGAVSPAELRAVASDIEQGQAPVVPMTAPVVPEPEGTKLFRFKLPDGTSRKIRGPADATPEEAFAALREKDPTVELLARVSEAQDTIHRGAEDAASLGTGLLRGGWATASLPLDVMNMTSTALGQRAPFPSSSDTREWLSNAIKTATGGTFGNLYEPQGREQRDIAAAGEMIPAMISKNPQALIAAAGGGVAGQELAHELPFSPLFGNPDINRAVGNVAGMVGTAFGMHPKVMLHAATRYLPETWRKATSIGAEDLAKALGETIPAERPVPLPDRTVTPLPPLPERKVEDLAGALLRPKVPFDLPKAVDALSSIQQWPYIKALYRLLGVPETQYQANQPPGAIIGQ